MATQLSIYNQALSRLGEPPVTSVDGTSPGPVTCTLHYASTVQELLRAHRWNFATKRTMLAPTQVTPTAVDTLTEFEITKASHGLTTGQRVTLSSSDNYPTIEGTWRVTVNGSDTFLLDDSVFAGSGAVDFTYALAGMWDQAYSIALPSDCLRALEDDRRESNISTGWVLESGRILTDSEELEFSYIEDVTDPTRFDSLFTQALVLRLAIKVGTALGTAESRMAPLAPELQAMLAPLARRVDANESQTRERLFPMQSHFVAARGACV